MANVKKAPINCFTNNIGDTNFIQFAALIAAYMQGNYKFHLLCSTTIVSTCFVWGNIS